MPVPLEMKSRPNEPVFAAFPASLCRFDDPMAIGSRSRNFSEESSLLGFPGLAWQLHSYLQQVLEPSGIRIMKIQAFATHEHALRVRAQRNEVLSSNIANADTPNYKARDLDFASALKHAQGGPGGALPMKTTSTLHNQGVGFTSTGAELKFRVPTQPTLDGNTVETDVEQAAFAENAVQYRASLTFLNGAISGLRYAIKGGD